MIINRKETWGNLSYDTKNHIFKYDLKGDISEQPFVSKPIVLNVDLTFKCNMDCVHCVARDTAEILGGVENADLKITHELIEKINLSDFIVVVITGGEPLLEDYEDRFMSLINGLKNKGIIIDTNGTIFPSERLLKILRIKDALVRVSWDIPNPKEEYKLRKYPHEMYEDKDEYIMEKMRVIRYLIDNGIEIAIQSVLHGQNYGDSTFYRFPAKLKELGVHKWYIQRFIPSYKKIADRRYLLSISEYNNSIQKVIRRSCGYNIKCYTKKDRRHNSVFLLVRNGEIYTQNDDVAGEKIFLGKIGEIKHYFEFVSSSEHSVRYY